MLQPGAVVEPYEVEAELGGGGMARVYRVRHRILGSVHALKVLDPELAVNGELRARFLEEGRIQAQLRHPNIVAVTDIVAAPGVAGLVMDFLEGQSLETFIDAREGRPPSADEVRDIFRQVLAGVGFAHAQGYVHRDLKPSNIFLQQVHGRRVARILDFGIAKAPGAEGKRATRTGARLGTPHYMSPEQVKDPRDTTPRSDVFSLGVTLYELATGRRCFDGDSEFLVMRSIVQGEFLSAEQVYPGIDPGLAAVIRKAMAPEPEQRFASCEAFAAALDAPPPSVAEPPARPVMAMSQAKAAPSQPPRPVEAAPARPSRKLSAVTEVQAAPPPRPPEPPPKPPPPRPAEAPRAASPGLSSESKAVGLLGLFGVLLLALWLRRAEQAPAPSQDPVQVPAAKQPSEGMPRQEPRGPVPEVPGGPHRSPPTAPATEPSTLPVPALGRLRLEVIPRVGVRIELTSPRGEQRTLAGAASVDEQVIPGRWKVRATALEHEPEERVIDVRAGESVMVELELAPVVPTTEAPSGQEEPSREAATPSQQVTPPDEREPSREPATSASEAEPPGESEEPLEDDAPEAALSRRFTADGFTVRDTRTGLLWTRRISDNAYSWEEAQRYCGSLVIAGGGWRLPERNELAALVQDREAREELRQALAGGAGGRVWSMTSFSGSQFGQVAWTAHLVSGDVEGLRTALQVRVLCVR